MQFSLFTTIALVATVNALTITEPKMGSEIQRSGTVELAWKSVSSDPTEFKIAFRRVGDSTSKAVTEIPGKVSVKDGKATIDGSSFPVEGKFVIYAVSTDGRGGILAESHAVEAKGATSTKTKSDEDNKKTTDASTVSGTSDSTATSSGTSGAAAASTVKKPASSGALGNTVSTVLLSCGLVFGFMIVA